MNEKSNKQKQIFAIQDILLFTGMIIIFLIDNHHQALINKYSTPINFTIIQYYFIPYKFNTNNNSPDSNTYPNNQQNNQNLNNQSQSYQKNHDQTTENQLYQDQNQANPPHQNQDSINQPQRDRDQNNQPQRDRDQNNQPQLDRDQNLINQVKHQSMSDVILNSEMRTKDFQILPRNVQETILSSILEIDIREPFYPVDSSCRVPTLLNYTQEACLAAGSAFTGNLRRRDTKMAHIINFAFEVDVLEIHLNELYPVVDKIFICEAPIIHGRTGLRKPCVWDMIKDQSRFSKFKDKVVHIMLSMSDVGMSSYRFNEWHVEYAMERLRWSKFLEWNKANNNFFKDDDIVGFGDTDEIASIFNLNLIKQCEAKTLLDVGIWFTRGRITEKVKTDWPVKNEPFALGDPSFFTLSQAKKWPSNVPKCHSPCHYPGRTRGFAPNYVLGGLHLSSYKYMPQYMLKLLSMTEMRHTEREELTRILNLVRKGENIQDIQRNISLRKFSHPLGGNIMEMDLNDIGKKQYILPWFLKCNEKRYSSFFLNVLDEPRLE